MHQKKLIFRIGGLEELGDRFPGLAHLVSHAAAGIENDPERQRSVLGAELRDLLVDLIFGEAEMILFQPRYQPCHGVGHRHVDQDQRNVDLDRLGPSPWARKLQRIARGGLQTHLGFGAESYRCTGQPAGNCEPNTYRL